MENPENKPLEPANTPTELGAQVAALRHTIGTLMLLVLLVSGAVNMYLWRQLKYINLELTPMVQQSAQITAECNRINSTANEFARRLIEFGKTNADFQPILNQFNLRPATTGAPPAKAVGPTNLPIPAPAAPKK